MIWNDGDASFDCSGALISKKHALFSAYCSTQIYKYWPRIEVRLGINTLSTMKRGVSRFYIHENYSADSFDFNIAIWQLDENVAFGFNNQPICLPKSSLVDYAGKLATAAGWYRDLLRYEKFEPTSMTTMVSINKLHQIHVPIWTNKECAAAHEQFNHPERLTNNMICAGEYEYGVRRACLDSVR